MSVWQRLVLSVRRNLVAWLALFFALAGTGIAAGRYIITSTSQIKPSVLRELRDGQAVSAAVPKGPKAVIDRIRLTTPTSTVTRPAEAALPISGGTWTQAVGQVNGIFGRVTFAPPQTHCEEDVGARATVTVRLDGLDVASASVPLVRPYGPLITSPLLWTLAFPFYNEGGASWLLDPTAATSHTLEARATDVCQDGSHFTIKALEIDVLGFR
jgi:hypothetical protein